MLVNLSSSPSLQLNKCRSLGGGLSGLLNRTDSRDMRSSMYRNVNSGGHQQRASFSSAVPEPLPFPPPIPSGEPDKEVEKKTGDAPVEKKKKPTIDRRVWPIALSTFVGGCGVGVLLPVMPVFAENLGLSTQDFGMVISIIGLTRLLVNIPAAWLTDRYGRRFTLIGGPVISGIGMAFTASSRSLMELVGFRFLTGVGSGFQMTGAQMYLSDISTKENRARTMAPMGIAFATGATIGPALGGWMSHTYGLRAPFIFVTSAIGMAALLNYVLVPETKKRDLTKKVPDTSIMAEFKSVASQWVPLFKNPDMRKVLLLHLTYWSVASGCSWTLLPLIARSTFNFSVGELGGMFALLSAIGIIGLGPAAYVSDKFGRKAAMLPATLIVSTTLMALPYAQTREQLLGLIGVYAFGATLFNSTPAAFVADISTEQTRGQALALLRSAGDAGLFIGAGGFGALSHAVSPTFAFGFASVALLAAGGNFARAGSTVKTPDA